MNSPNVLALGFLLFTANLSFGVLFSPAWGASRWEDRFLRVFQLWILAAVEVAAWALVLYQGGAAAGRFDALKTSLAWFTQLGWWGAPLPGPFGDLSYFIAVNGILFLPVTLLPLVRRKPLPQPEEVVLPASFQKEIRTHRKSEPVQEPPAPAPAPKLPPKLPSQRAAEAALAAKAPVPGTGPVSAPVSAPTEAPVLEASGTPQFLETPVELNPLLGGLPAAASPGSAFGPGHGPDLQRGGFRPL